jgi:hypothetical protein
MKTKLTALLFLLLVFIGNAQIKDSIYSSKKQDKLSYKQFIAPVALITAGTLLLNSKLNDDLQSNANRFFGENSKLRPIIIFSLLPLRKSIWEKPLGSNQRMISNTKL